MGGVVFLPNPCAKIPTPAPWNVTVSGSEVIAEVTGWDEVIADVGGWDEIIAEVTGWDEVIADLGGWDEVIAEVTGWDEVIDWATPPLWLSFEGSLDLGLHTGRRP